MEQGRLPVQCRLCSTILYYVSHTSDTTTPRQRRCHHCPMDTMDTRSSRVSLRPQHLQRIQICQLKLLWPSSLESIVKKEKLWLLWIQKSAPAEHLAGSTGPCSYLSGQLGSYSTANGVSRPVHRYMPFHSTGMDIKGTVPRGAQHDAFRPSLTCQMVACPYQTGSPPFHRLCNLPPASAWRQSPPDHSMRSVPGRLVPQDCKRSC